eukprot:4481779-Pyramimonas_sp.AAC.1
MVDALRARVSFWGENFARWTHADLPDKIRHRAQEARSIENAAAAFVCSCRRPYVGRSLEALGASDRTVGSQVGGG